MIALNKGQILGCLGPPDEMVAERWTDVWSYHSGDNAGEPDANSRASGWATTVDASTAKGICTVRIVIREGKVARVTYSNAAGEPVGTSEPCAAVVRDCMRLRAPAASGAAF
jgi:hypothetical protein